MMIPNLIAASLALANNFAAVPPKAMNVEVSKADTIDRTTQTEDVAIRTDNAGRMTVSVSVGGQGPYHFLVDTGSERTVISRELADQLRLTSGRSAILHSVMGANDVSTVHIPHLKFSGKVVSVADAPALGASSIGADGMLGIDSLRSQRVLFDFKARTMSITPANVPVEKLEGNTIVVRARTKNGRLIFTQARIGGRKVPVIVDTGAQVSIANLALLKMLTKRGVETLEDTVTIESVTGERMNARVTKLEELDLDGLKVRDLPVAFADAHVFRQLDMDDKPALLLGMNAMKAFDRISIDFAAKKVRFVLPATSMRTELRLAAAGQN